MVSKMTERVILAGLKDVGEYINTLEQENATLRKRMEELGLELVARKIDISDLVQEKYFLRDHAEKAEANSEFYRAELNAETDRRGKAEAELSKWVQNYHKVAVSLSQAEVDLDRLMEAVERHKEDQPYPDDSYYGLRDKELYAVLDGIKGV